MVKEGHTRGPKNIVIPKRHQVTARANPTLLQSLEVVVKSESNLVGKFAKEKHLKLHRWPSIATHEQFDVGLIVSFGHLIPEKLINTFPLGMINVHGSLLPKYRGAAPIIHALANGDKETGITIVKLQPRHFDVGEIISQQKVDIDPNMSMPELHEIMGRLGAILLVEAIRNLPKSVWEAKPQPVEGVSYAPKVTPEFGQIDWKTMTAREVWNRFRALKGMYPLYTYFYAKKLKILDLSLINDPEIRSNGPGCIKYNKKNKILLVECADNTFVSLRIVNVPGKKNMNAQEFQSGYLKNIESAFCDSFKP